MVWITAAFALLAGSLRSEHVITPDPSLKSHMANEAERPAIYVYTTTACLAWQQMYRNVRGERDARREIRLA
jgi:hypothetical protein